MPTSTATTRVQPDKHLWPTFLNKPLNGISDSTYAPFTSILQTEPEWPFENHSFGYVSPPLSPSNSLAWPLRISMIRSMSTISPSHSLLSWHLLVSHSFFHSLEKVMAPLLSPPPMLYFHLKHTTFYSIWITSTHLFDWICFLWENFLFNERWNSLAKSSHTKFYFHLIKHIPTS